MRHAKIILIAVVISLSVHTIFFALSSFIRVHGIRDVIENTSFMFRLKDASNIIKRVDGEARTRAEIPALSLESPEEIDDSLTFKDLSVAEESLREMAYETKKDEIAGEYGESVEITDITETMDIFEADAERIAKEVSPEKRRIDYAVVRAREMPQILTAGKSPVKVEIPSGYLFRENVEADRPGFSGEDRGFEEDAEAVSVATVKQLRVGEYDDVGSLMDVKIKVFEDPATGDRYFKAVVDANDRGELQVLSKEVTFLIDSSKSITEDKLREVINGVSAAVQDLNPGDRFNIASFSGNLIRFSDLSVYVTEKEVDRARFFLRKLRAVGQTDVENALFRIVNKEAPMNPSYVVLVTDGRPTKGMVDSRGIIQEITRANDMKKPIFCFGGGRKVNRYLLEFISYQNRAWSHFAPHERDIDTGFVSYFNEIKDPLLLDVRFNFAGIDSKEVYPKFLPDFFRGRSFVIYGKIGQEKSFTLQLLGDTGGFTKEMVYTADLSVAEKGGPEIAREWAFMKIYYLISIDTMGARDPGLIKKEIEALSNRYNIKTSYEISGQSSR